MNYTMRYALLLLIAASTLQAGESSVPCPTHQETVIGEEGLNPINQTEESLISDEQGRKKMQSPSSMKKQTNYL